MTAPNQLRNTVSVKCAVPASGTGIPENNKLMEITPQVQLRKYDSAVQFREHSFKRETIFPFFNYFLILIHFPFAVRFDKKRCYLFFSTVLKT